VWINVSVSSYEAVWGSRLSVRLAGADMGELRQRRGLALPVVAGLGGLIAAVAIYLAITPGSAPVAGGRRCPPTPRSRWGCWL
jgi:Na+/H+ antiporter 1